MTWLRLLVLTLCMLHIKLPSTHQIQGNCLVRQFSNWSTIWGRLMIWAYISSLIPPRVLSATVMQTSQGCGTRHLHLRTPVLPSHEVVGSFSMQDALSLGPPSFNPKLHCPLLKLSILQSCHKLDVMSFLSWDYYRTWGSKISRLFVPSPMFIAWFLKTTQAPSNWQGFPSFALEPSTSMYATIIFANMCGRGLSKKYPATIIFANMCERGLSKNPHWHQDCWHSYQALGTTWISTSSSPHVRQVTSTSNQNEGMLRYEKLWYLFYRYLRVSRGTMQKCMLYSFVW